MEIKSKGFGVYEIYCKVSNKTYVGSTINSFNRRCHQHASLLRKGTHHSSKLQRSWNKYKEESFEFRILEELEDKDELFCRKREKYWLDKLDSFKTGLNESEFTEGLLGVKRLSGEKCHNAKLNKDLIISMKADYEDGLTLKQLAKKYKISTHPIRVALLGRTFKEFEITPVKFRKYPQGGRVGSANITDEEAIIIINRYKNGERAKDLAIEFNSALPSIRSMCNGLTWRHIKIERKHLKESEFGTEVSRKPKLTSEQLSEIDKMLIENKISQREIAKLFNVCEQTISCIKLRSGIYKKLGPLNIK